MARWRGLWMLAVVLLNHCCVSCRAAVHLRAGSVAGSAAEYTGWVHRLEAVAWVGSI